MRVWGMSKMLQNLPFRVVIRPLGVSVIKQDSNIAAINNVINNTVLRLSSAKEDVHLQLSKVISSNQPNKSLHLVAAVKLMLLPMLDILDKQIASSPSSILNSYS